MTTRSRRNHSPAFKAKVALAAVKGEKTTMEENTAYRRDVLLAIIERVNERRPYV